MTESLFSREYATLLRILRDARQRARLTQLQLAERLGQTQSFVSKCERGQRRLDVVELRAYCGAMGITLQDLISELDRAIEVQH